MAPTRSKKRKSTESTSSVDAQGFPAPPQLVPTKTRSPGRTAIARSPVKKARMGITLAQKQALIDNLQLESKDAPSYTNNLRHDDINADYSAVTVTERARKLRSQYMLQAQGLRTRIEIRVNRIPVALRRANMGELFLKYSQSASNNGTTGSGITRALPGKIHSPSKTQLPDSRNPSPLSTRTQRGTKRQSDEISSIDKENENIENPKKKSRGDAGPDQSNSRAKLPPTQVLSPRSANSRAQPRSPVRTALSPGKSYLARPVSPAKGAAAAAAAGGATCVLMNMVEQAKTARATAARQVTVSGSSSSTVGAGRGKKAAPTAAKRTAAKGRASTTSDSSSGDTSSSATTVAKKAAPVKKAPAKRTVMTTIKGMGGTTSKKLPAAKPAASTTGTRVLRKRN